MGSQPEDDPERLLEVIVESDQAIRTGREVPDDPVAVRLVTDALISKAMALSDLGRLEESLAIWNELLARALPARTRFWVADWKLWGLVHDPADSRIPDAVDELVRLFYELEGPKQDISVVADALMRKSYALERLWAGEEAAAVDVLLLEVFGGDIEAASTISSTLANTVWRMLQTPESFGAALIASDQLQGRLASEPDESLPHLVDVVVRTIQVLTGISKPTLAGTASLAAITLLNSSVEGWRAGQSFLIRRAPHISSLVPGPNALEIRAVRIDVVDRSRRRFRQALSLCDSLIERIGDSEDAELRRSAAIAKIYRGVTLTGLGHIRDGFRAFDCEEARKESGAAGAYQQIADAAKPPKWLRAVGLASLLSLRAAALGGSDDAITQLAYEQAINELPAETRNGRLARLVIRFLGPRTRATVVVPDYPPGSPPT